MQIEKTVKLLAAATVLLLTFAQAPAQTTTNQNEGDSAQTEQPTSETPTTDPGEKSAEGGDNPPGKTPAEVRDNTRAEDADDSDITPFTPSETISADSAIAFPVDI